MWKKLFGGKSKSLTSAKKPKVEKSHAVPIHDAARRGDLERVRALLNDDPGVINSKDENWMTPLHMAAEQGHVNVVTFLLSNKAEVSTANIVNSTALHSAAEKGHANIVELLLTSGACVNLRTSKTPLHVAAGANQKNVVELLLAKGADVNARDVSGETPFDWAMHRGHKDVADLLRQRVDVSAPERNGATPLADGWDDGCDEVVLLMTAAFSGTGFLVSQFMTPAVMMKLGARLGEPAERLRKSDLACEKIKSFLTGPVNEIDRNLTVFAHAAAQRIFLSRSRNSPSALASLLVDMEDLACNGTASLSKNVIENCKRVWTGQQLPF